MSSDRELKERLKIWKDGLEEKRLKVSVGMTKDLCSRHNVSKLKIASVKFPCGVCMKSIGANSILCLSCRNWVHRQSSGIKASLRNCVDFICKTCSTTTRAVDPFPTCITIDKEDLKIVNKFCYLGDVLGQADGYTDAVNGHIGSAWKALHELLPILINKGISLVIHGKVFQACVRSVPLYGSETWPLSTEDLSQIK